MKTLAVPQTQALQAALRNHNQVAADYGSFWKQLINSFSYSRVQSAATQVSVEYKNFLSTNPSADVADQVKGWLGSNAKDAVALMSRLNANY